MTTMTQITQSVGARLTATLWFLFGALFWAGCAIGVLVQLVCELTTQRAPELPSPPLASDARERQLAASAGRVGALAPDAMAPSQASHASGAIVETADGGAAVTAVAVDTLGGVSQQRDTAPVEIMRIYVPANEPDYAQHAGEWHLIRPTPGTCWPEMKEVWN